MKPLLSAAFLASRAAELAVAASAAGLMNQKPINKEMTTDKYLLRSILLEFFSLRLMAAAVFTFAHGKRKTLLHHMAIDGQHPELDRVTSRRYSA